MFEVSLQYSFIQGGDGGMGMQCLHVLSNGTLEGNFGTAHMIRSLVVPACFSLKRVKASWMDEGFNLYF
jgi:hypothetical protein